MFSKDKISKTVPEEKNIKPSSSSTPPSIFSNNLLVKGDLYSEGDIQLDGQVDGDIRSKDVTIGKSAVINGAVMGDTLRIAGTVNGEITARVVTLTSTARVTGDINHDSLSIQAGAYVQGLCKRIEIDVAKLLANPNSTNDKVKP